MPIVPQNPPAHGSPPQAESSTFTTPVLVTINDAANVAVLGLNSAASGIGVRGEAPSGTGVYGTSASQNGVKGESQNGDAVLGLSHSSVHAGVSAQNDKGGPGVWASGSPAGYFAGDVHATGTITADGSMVTVDMHAKGTITVDTDIVFSNAADFAEDFDLSCGSGAEPGTVMVLGEHGGLEPSGREYDRKVAGVISGAGTYKPGLILDRRAEGGERRPLALVGKVFCKVDAAYGGIEPGDLLTTSPTPGHAMRAADPARAFGAVIGKALGTCEEGRALVPILVALQ